ncbi:MAG: hypothetical protein RL757_1343 [Bacteroidota bacterium]|jgi:Kef-type K+ transport system membrane component KefB/nucleotide-binding universal stress UspA family protein
MMPFLDLHWTLPISNQVLLFAVLLVVILVMPLLFRKLKIPGIVGLILGGVALGPKGGGVIAFDNAMQLFSTIGLLYIMFLAGLEIDFRDFQRNARKSIVFGSLTFSIPLLVGTISTWYLLDFSFISSLLLAGMYATHTLISYPIVSRLGITKNEAVVVTVGGTILTDTAALLLLSVIAASSKGSLNSIFIAEMISGLIIFALVVLGIIPMIGKWFFKNVDSEGTSQYIFTLAVVFIAATLAELAKVEPIIGAFLAGLALNRLIPHTSALMNRIIFVGNALFIPFFLIRVGMAVDLRVLFGSWASWRVAFIIISVAYVTKWLAAYLTQQFFRYSVAERNLIFGLGSAHAAATLAIVLVGFELKLFDESVLNGTVLLILVSCIVSTFITEKAAKQIALAELQTIKTEDSEDVQRILVPLANPANFEQLIDLAIFIKNEKEREVPIFPLSVVADDDDARQNILINDRLFNRAKTHAAAADIALNVMQRIERNVASGISSAARDLAISDIVIGWSGKSSAVDFFFGSLMSQVLTNADQTVLVSKMAKNYAFLKEMNVVLPPNAELESGFGHWTMLLYRLSKQLDARATFRGNAAQLVVLKDFFKKEKMHFANPVYQILENWEEWETETSNWKDQQLWVFVAARPHTLSYARTMNQLPKTLAAEQYEQKSFIVLYPTQLINAETTETFLR